MAQKCGGFGGFGRRSKSESAVECWNSPAGFFRGLALACEFRYNSGQQPNDHEVISENNKIARLQDYRIITRYQARRRWCRVDQEAGPQRQPFGGGALALARLGL